MSAIVRPRDTTSNPPPVPSGEMRIDSAHQPSDAAPNGISEDLSGVDAPTASELDELAADSPSPESLEAYEQLLQQATEIAGYVSQQCAELDRREQALHSQLAQLDQERRSVRLWVSHFESQVHDREDALAEREAEWNLKTARCLQLEQELQQLHEDLHRQEEALQAQRAAFLLERDQTLQEIQSAREHLDGWLKEASRELDVERAECDAQLAAERNRHRMQLEQDRRELHAERQRLTSELSQERIRLENRANFQREHLQRMREELERTQAQVRFEQQQQQADLAELAAQLDRRRSQIGRARELLEQRQVSFEREVEHLARSRRLFAASLQTGHQALQSEREQWDAERSRQQAELQRQQDLLAAHGETLETRRVRLDRLRAELEDSNRRLLEERVAVEDVWSQLNAVAGGDAALQRVNTARQVLGEHYRHTREDLQALRQELAEQELRLVQQAEQLNDERDALSEWASEQDARLERERTDLDASRQVLARQQEVWQQQAEQWASERAEAEAVIRDLLRQLSQADIPPDEGWASGAGPDRA